MAVIDNIPVGVYVAWWTGLIVVLFLVPVAVWLLHRTLRAALSIRQYLAEMEAAGGRIANNVTAISALQETEVTAGKLIETAQGIEQRARGLSGTLSSRLQQRGDRP